MRFYLTLCICLAIKYSYVYLQRTPPKNARHAGFSFYIAKLAVAMKEMQIALSAAFEGGHLEFASKEES